VSSELSSRQIGPKEFNADSQGKRILIHRRGRRQTIGARACFPSFGGHAAAAAITAGELTPPTCRSLPATMQKRSKSHLDACVRPLEEGWGTDDGGRQACE